MEKTNLGCRVSETTALSGKVTGYTVVSLDADAWPGAWDSISSRGGPRGVETGG